MDAARPRAPRTTARKADKGLQSPMSAVCDELILTKRYHEMV